MRQSRFIDPRVRILSRGLTRRLPASLPRDPFSGEELFLRRVWRSTRIQWMRFALGAFLIWAAYSLILSPHGWFHLAALRQQVAVEAQANAALEAKRDSLDLVVADIDRGGSDVLVRRAREEFGFARENERVYLLPVDAEDSRSRAEAEIRGGDRFSDRARQGLTKTAGRR
jgi:cell division protein FtsB